MAVRAVPDDDTIATGGRRSGSNDGKKWLPYEFKWKPGDVNHRPGLVAPFQPRLDWQMWFAALGDYRDPRNQWFLLFLQRLLEGSPEVLHLMASNPFPPPLRVTSGPAFTITNSRVPGSTRRHGGNGNTWL